MNLVLSFIVDDRVKWVLVGNRLITFLYACMHANKSDQNSASKCLNPIPGRIPRKIHGRMPRKIPRRIHGRIHKLPDSLKWAFFKIPLLECYETLPARWKYVS